VDVPDNSARMGARRTTAALILAVGAAVGVCTSAAADQQPPDAARQAGCAFGRALATYDYTDFDDYRTRVLDGSTGIFRVVFDDNSQSIRNQLAAVHVRSSAKDATCRVESGSPNRALIAVALTSVIAADATHGQPQAQHVAVALTVDNVNGRWLTSAIDTPSADAHAK